MHASRRPKSTFAVCALSLGLTLAACDDPFPEEPVRSFGDFGTEVFELIHDELLWSGTPAEGAARAAAFSAHRDDVIWALNSLRAGKVDDGMLPLLEEFLPLYDDRPGGKPGAMPIMTRDLSGILAELAGDDAALEALARIGTAPEANPSAITRFLGALARHPIDVVDPMVDLTLDLEPTLTELFRWLHRELPTLEEGYVVRSDEKTFIQRLLEVQIEVATEPIGPPVMSARFDGRGAPAVQRLPNGQWPAPFADQNGDDQIDVDAYSRPLDASGQVIALPTFAFAPTSNETRDQLGRALVEGQLVFDYFDLRRTVIAFLMRDARKLAADGAHHDLFVAFDALLGGRVTRTDADGDYTGFFVEDSPLLDLAFMLNEVRRYDRIVPLLRSVDALVKQREPLFRQLFMDLAKVRRIMQDAPSLTPGNALLEDIHPTLAHLAEGGGLRALMAAARKPGTDGMFEAMATMMSTTRLSVPQDTSLLETPADVDALRFSGDTPWSSPDTDDSQRSWLQKAAYLIADTKGAPVYMKLFDRVEIEEIAITLDMAHFYITAIAGEARLDLTPDFLEDAAIALASEFDDRILQAEELNLYMNHDQPVTGNPVGNRGVQIRNLYGPALLALQTSGNLVAMRPWVDDLVAKGLTDDFVDLFDVLARHYSETAFTAGPFVSDGTGFRRVEPYLVRVLRETDFGEHFLELSAWADTATITVDGQTTNVADELDRFVRWLLDPDAALALRNGQTSIPGKRGAITKPSRLQVLVHAFDRIDAALDASPEARAAWDNVDLLGIFLDLDAGGELVNQHALEVAVKLLPILADEVEQAVSEPDWAESIDTFMADLEEAMGSRGFTALVDTMRKIKDTPRHRAFVDAFVQALLAEEPPTPDADLMGASLQVLSTVGQMRLPIDAGTRVLRYAGRLLEPAKRRMFNPMECMRDMRAFDEARVTTDLGKNLFVEPEVGKTPIGALADAFKSALRTVPGASGPYEVEDLRLVIRRLSDWLVDDVKGMEHMYEVIEGR